MKYMRTVLANAEQRVLIMRSGDTMYEREKTESEECVVQRQATSDVVW